MSQLEAMIRLEERFVLLRQIIQDYRGRLAFMDEEVIRLFSTNQLSAISSQIAEKQRIERMIQQLEAFVSHYEPLADAGITHDSQRF
ncbi:hypothetical protein EDM56_13370 [Brevibacillus fluminis]|uniref:Uncharacterized protein n=2 Tax=Brevibacillus fluminis TaxID=511487 RepID=A0A3M8DI61_9BACL|nr:hypothetical protein EDM56_13370 [Brevibacillus fluminis]